MLSLACEVSVRTLTVLMGGPPATPEAWNDGIEFSCLPVSTANAPHCDLQLPGLRPGKAQPARAGGRCRVMNRKIANMDVDADPAVSSGDERQVAGVRPSSGRPSGPLATVACLGRVLSAEPGARCSGRASCRFKGKVKHAPAACARDGGPAA